MKILITDPISEEGIAALRKEHEVVVKEMDKNELLKAVPEFDALIVRSKTKVTKEIIEAGKNLKVIGRAGVGVDNIDVPAALARKIVVVNSPTAATNAVAELTIGMMLAWARKLPKADRTTRAGRWAKKELEGTELRGKTLGLIGSGRIAQRVAEIAKAFGMNVIAYSPHMTPDKAARMGAKPTDINTLFKESDYLSLHIPYTKECHHIVNKERIALMKKNAVIVNCARGGTVDEKALYEAIRDKKIAGAALDCYENEPLGLESPLERLDNVLFAPHIGASTEECQKEAGILIADQVLKALRGEKAEFEVKSI